MTQEKIKPYDGICISHMLLHIAKSWKKMLIAMVILAVLLGGLSYYKNAKGLAAGEEAEKDEKEEILLTDETQILENAGLNEKAADEVLYYANKYYYNQVQYERQRDYLKDSILMQLDPNHVWTITLYYQLSMMDGGEGDAALAASYLSRVLCDEVYDEIAETLNVDTDSGYFSEVITGSYLDSPSENGDITVTFGGEDMKILIRYQDEAGCEEIARIIREKMDVSKQDVTKEAGAHEISLVGLQKEEKSDLQLLEEQKEAVNTLGALSDNVINARSNVEANEETVFYELVEYYTARDQKKGSTVKASEDEEERSAKDITVKPRVSWKYVALGLFLGIFLVGAWEGIWYFFSDTVKRQRELEEAYGLSVYNAEDGALLSLLIGSKCAKNGYHSIYAASSLGIKLPKPAFSGKDVKLLQGENSPFEDEDELEKFLGADGVVLVEQCGATSHKELVRLLELCRELEKPVLCAVMAKEE
ncbi:MAG: hypothetical protein J1E61_00360 [Lachnospiraceae bacterium]|nr:hypothetical protein [Lachnospiraceae bacterium]